ncbi:lipid IV(A) 3-deoxy-D-manno-octulosonic acid transferase [Photobacterium toruni]|uniref:lipid IV(A) 3-deoxy-D-manno-octulosonic acid transferase n=1 Tax=Photobacterium toruni TaxID=1935446 RepID=UPI00210F6CB4|nr:lipid IV(A) 3-deoxy-D-manno-octulosonic acid transferase [Photobacterium toruni]
MIRIIYTLLLLLVSPILLFGLYRKKIGKPRYGKRWKEHFGITPKFLSNKKPIWIHAVSVGESIAAIPLIQALKKQHPYQPIIVTTTTSTGAEQISKLGDLVEHRYMPIDFEFAIKGFIKTINPQKMLIIETELWPNTLHEVNKHGIPIIIVNARLSEKSCQNYKKIQPLFNLIHPKITKILCQTQADAERFNRLGVAKEKLSITGSIKFDIDISDDVINKASLLRTDLGKTRPIWIAASTHQGEDEQVLSAHKKVLKEHPNTLLILVPRHPERFNSIFELCQQQGFKTIRRTSDQKVTESTQVYVGDTMGEMLILLGAADICFMGGSLIGNKVGGHNVLEPAALGIPIITGPSYFNFKDIVDNLYSNNAINICSTSNELSTDINSLINNQDNYHSLSKKLLHFINLNKGAIQLTIMKISDL